MERAQAAALMGQAGAFPRSQFNSRTTLLIQAGRRGAVVERAITQGIEIWSEQRLVDELDRYHQHLQTSAPADQYCAWQPAVTRCATDIHAVLGLPVARHVYDGIVGDQLTYMLTNEAYDALWELPGKDSLQALWVRYLSDEHYADCLTRLSSWSQLRALVLQPLHQTIDVSCVLDALPLLQCLYLGIHDKAHFAISRHANLEQLVLPCSEVTDLLLMSLPKLQYLHMHVGQSELLRQVMTQQLFPRLGHIGLCGGFRYADVLGGLDNLDSIHTLSLDYSRAVPPLLADELDKLAETPLARHLQHLTVRNEYLAIGEKLTQSYFPQLKTLKFIVDFDYVDMPDFHEHIARLDFAAGLTLDFSYAGMNSQQAAQIARGLKNKPPLALLDLQYNRVGAKAVRERLEKQSYPINLDNQYTR